MMSKSEFCRKVEGKTNEAVHEEGASVCPLHFKREMTHTAASATVIYT